MNGYTQIWYALVKVSRDLLVVCVVCILGGNVRCYPLMQHYLTALLESFRAVRLFVELFF